MARRVIGSDRLTQLYRGNVKTQKDARAVAAARLADHPQDGILTSIRLELLGGTRDQTETHLTTIFLDAFSLFDGGHVLAVDWSEAERLAKRVPASGRSRGAVDCLIRAICQRLHLEIDTDDRGMPG